MRDRMGRRIGCTLAGLTVLGAAAACAEPPGSEGEPAALPLWSVHEELRIGREDDPDYALSGVGAGGIAVTSRGEVVVLQRTEMAVRVFDAATGTFVRRFGGAGEGPGEFRLPGPVGLVGDTLWVSDVGWVHFFDLEGRPLRSERVEATPEPPFARGQVHALAGGRRLMLPSRPLTLSQDPSVTQAPLQLYAAGGGIEATVPGEPIVPTVPLGEVDGRTVFGTLPFHYHTAWAVAPGGASFVRVELERPQRAPEAALRIVRHGPGGEVLAEGELRLTAPPVSAAQRDSVLEAQAERMANTFGGIEAARRAVRAGIDVPSFRLPVSGLIAGVDGWIWLELTGTEDAGGGDASGEDAGAEVEWLVLDPDLAPVARVRLPPGATPLWVEAREAWGVERDALDVPTVVRWRVVESGRDG